MTKPGNLRETMPTVAWFVDFCREVAGPQAINAQIRGGLDGQPTFYAKENGIEVGTPWPHGPGITLDRIALVSDQERIEQEVGKNGRR